MTVRPAGGRKQDRRAEPKRLRVLVVSPMPASANGPGAIPVVIHALLTGLSARHSVALVTVAGGTEEWQREAVRDLVAAGVDVHPVYRPDASGLIRASRRTRMASAWIGGRPLRSVWFAEPGVQGVLDSLLSTRPFDVVTVEDNSMATFRYPRGVPRIITEYEVRRPRPVSWSGVSSRDRVRWGFRELDWRRLTAYQQAAWTRFDRIQVFSRRDAEAVGALAPQLTNRVRVTPFGTELPPLPPPEPAGARTLVFFGNYSHLPNVDAAVFLAHEVMPFVRRRASDVRLLLVGPSPPNEVRSLTAADIEVTGGVPYVDRLLAECAVVVAPVRIGGGMRMKVLHAMALGKAVITTSRGIDGLDAIGALPPLIVADEPDAVADAAARLLAAPETRRALGLRARAFVAEHFSPDAFARRVEATYMEVVRGPETREHGG